MWVVFKYSPRSWVYLKENAEISSDEKAKKKFGAWKDYLLRSINQDEAGLDVLRNLDAYWVLLVLKYLPRKYCLSQTDWFGKWVIPWHITTATRIVEGQPQNNAVICSHFSKLWPRLHHRFGHRWWCLETTQEHNAQCKYMFISDRTLPNANHMQCFHTIGNSAGS